MKISRTTLVDVVLLLLAAPLWVLIAIEIRLRGDPATSVPRDLVGPIVLCGMTAAIHHLLRSRKNAWPLSALIAGVAVLAVLMWSAG